MLRRQTNRFGDARFASAHSSIARDVNDLDERLAGAYLHQPSRSSLVVASADRAALLRRYVPPRSKSAEPIFIAMYSRSITIISSNATLRAFSVTSKRLECLRGDLGCRLRSVRIGPLAADRFAVKS